MEKRNIRVLIADDHLLFRAGLRSLIGKLDHVELVGEATDGHDLVRRSHELMPDVILTDINMPGMDGIAAAKEIIRRKISSRIIMLSAYGREEPILKTLEAGALGFVLKTADNEEIFEAIETVYGHKPYFCREITHRLTEIVSKNYQPPPPEADFTEREKEIMRMLCRELTSKEIAHALHLSRRTVEGHRTRIMDKIHAKSTAGIITYAMIHGIYRKPGMAN